MTTYTPVNPDLTGAAPNLVAVSSSDTFPNNGKRILHVKNASGSSINVTVDDPGSVSPANATAFNPDDTVAVPAGAERYIGPFPVERFNDANGNVNVAYSATTSVTAEVIDAG
jgi:hypothetical protein